MSNLSTTDQSIHSYIGDKKKQYDAIFNFLKDSDLNSDLNISQNKFELLTKIVENQLIENSHEEMKEFLQIVKNICDNHHRERNFLSKINQILQYFKDQIKNCLTNDDIFEIFESNKNILLYMINNDILTITESIYKEMMNKLDSNGFRYCYFFYPEIEKFIGEEKVKDVKQELLSQNSNVFENFDSKRQEGENDSYICSLIRQDSVQEFIAYVNHHNYPLSNKIEPSIFETNRFLIENKNTTLIEYSAFFGSIQIFQYLLMNKVQLTPSLWLYTIHSENAELIYLLESNKVFPPKITQIKKNEEEDKDDDDENTNDNYLLCLIESIKCHHNEIAEYIQNNLMNQEEKEKTETIETIVSNSIKYHNYSYFQVDAIIEYGFFYFCFNDYNKFIELLLNAKKDEIEKRIIQR